jgi:putative methionine-R-sulfoxide reductase with GAF domain
MNPSEFKPKRKWREEHTVIIFFTLAALTAYLMDVTVDAFAYHYGSFWDVFTSSSPGILYGRIYIVISFALIGVFMDLYMTYRRRTEQRFSALNSYGRKLFAANDIQEVCNLTLDAIEKTLGFEYATFMVLKESNLEVVGYRGRAKPRLHQLSMSGTKGIKAKAAKKGVTVLVRDVTKETDFITDSLKCGRNSLFQSPQKVKFQESSMLKAADREHSTKKTPLCFSFWPPTLEQRSATCRNEWKLRNAPAS